MCSLHVKFIIFCKIHFSIRFLQYLRQLQLELGKLTQLQSKIQLEYKKALQGNFPLN